MHWHCDIGFRIMDHNSIITVYLNTLKALVSNERNCRKIQLSPIHTTTFFTVAMFFSTVFYMGKNFHNLFLKIS